MITNNPLFPQNPETDKPTESGSYMLPQKSTKLEPLGGSEVKGANTAADLIRAKLANIYANEPDAQQESSEAEHTLRRSKHQTFMYELSTSGKSLADIQTEWHNYYVSLPDDQKHQVWQEFYASNQHNQDMVANTRPFTQPLDAKASAQANQEGIVIASQTELPLPQPERTVHKRIRREDLRQPDQIKAAILHHVTSGGKLKGKHHLQSLLFGVGSGLIVVFIFLFGFFNEVIIAPFIQPSRTVSATPIIVDPNTVTASSSPQIIIPKINLQIPVDYSQTTTSEAAIENALENGIVHYPTTEIPGQSGNATFFGHSSNNIFNKGKYKFAFVLLHELVPGDTFYITTNGKVYIYKVISKAIVPPSQVSVLNDVPGHAATATLITCDPPGTSLNRLVVVGEQISPDPSGNTPSTGGTMPINRGTTHDLPGNGPTLWTRMWRSIF